MLKLNLFRSRLFNLKKEKCQSVLDQAPAKEPVTFNPMVDLLYFGLQGAMGGHYVQVSR